MEAVTAKLISLQEELGLSGAEMARALGLSEPGWSRIRNGNRKLGAQSLLRALRVFPELWPAFLLDVASARGTNPRALCRCAHVGYCRTRSRSWSTPLASRVAGPAGSEIDFRKEVGHGTASAVDSSDG